MRILRAGISPNQEVVCELEFENLSELDKYWTEWFALPETPAFMETWNKLLVNNTTNEVWNVEE